MVSFNFRRYQNLVSWGLFGSIPACKLSKHIFSLQLIILGFYYVIPCKDLVLTIPSVALLCSMSSLEIDDDDFMVKNDFGN